MWNIVVNWHKGVPIKPTLGKEQELSLVVWEQELTVEHVNYGQVFRPQARENFLAQGGTLPAPEDKDPESWLSHADTCNHPSSKSSLTNPEYYG